MDDRDIKPWKARIGGNDAWGRPYERDIDAANAEIADLRAALEQCGANAPWLTLAHIICTDAGIPPGHIMQRLEALRDKLAPGYTDATLAAALAAIQAEQ